LRTCPEAEKQHDVPWAAGVRVRNWLEHKHFCIPLLCLDEQPTPP